MPAQKFTDAHTSTVHEDTMCSIMPLRLGIFLVACFTTIWCFCLLAFKGFAETMIIFTGGYCLKSRMALTLIEATGVIFGLCGAMGAWNCKRIYVLTFNVWQVFRILVAAWVYFVDVPILDTCEYWVNDVDAMIAKYGWNDLMYKIAMRAVCSTERTRFWIGSGFSFLLLIYITWCTHRYVEEVGAVPRHLLRIPKDLTSGSWYAHPVGERPHQTGGWGASDFEAPPVKFAAPADPILAAPGTGGNYQQYGSANPASNPGFAV